MATACEHGRICAAREGRCDVEVLWSIAERNCGRHRRGHVLLVERLERQNRLSPADERQDLELILKRGRVTTEKI